MSSDSQQLQNQFLNNLRKAGTQVSVFLTSGERLDGRIKSFDIYSLSLSCPEPRLIVKTGIATVQPAVKGGKKSVARAPVVLNKAAAPRRTGAPKAPEIHRKVRRTITKT
jgi:host factor-I protein